MNRTLQNAVNFACWCTKYHLEPREVANLISLADERSLLAIQECNEPDLNKAKEQRAREKRARADFEQTASDMGFVRVYWNSMARPTLGIAGNNDIYLPKIR